MSQVEYGFEKLITTAILPETLWRLFVNPAFVDAVEKIRKDLKISHDVLYREVELGAAEELSEEQIEEQVFERLSEIAARENVQAAAKKLAIKFRVPKRWLNALVNEIVYVGPSWVSEVYDPDAVSLRVRIDEETKEAEFFIKINETTSRADVVKHWSAVRKIVKS